MNGLASGFVFLCQVFPGKNRLELDRPFVGEELIVSLRTDKKNMRWFEDSWQLPQMQKRGQEREDDARKWDFSYWKGKQFPKKMYVLMPG